ncbi:hypothetical protein, partial [Bradyrhizobium sp.]|uniref:hypothetical protein n=1 Tax=Bradyrhizobium sp. TaxID=376 RepID=UPI00391BF81E
MTRISESSSSDVPPTASHTVNCGRAHCPVLLRPQFTVCEAVGGTSEEEDSEILVMRLLRRRVRKAWKSFK